MSNQKGFSGVVALVVVAVLVVMGLVGWRLWDAVADDDDSSSDINTTVVDKDTEVADTDEVDVEAIMKEYTVDVWADNWFALYVNGEMVGEDSVPITTERSFNKETFTFSASLPMTVAIEAKDFKETDSGIEYIGANNQQMGDGGIIAQIKDADGNVVLATNGEWKSFVTHFAPLDKSCESSSDPDTDCEFEITATPDGWYAESYDDSSWANANTYSESEVNPKIGYDEVNWDSSAELIWGSDLEQVNTILLRASLLQ